MAEIPIQRKTGSNVWMWIIGLLVLLALAWFFFARDRDTVATTPLTDSTSVITAPAVTVPATTAPATTPPGTMAPATPTGTPPVNPNP